MLAEHQEEEFYRLLQACPPRLATRRLNETQDLLAELFGLTKAQSEKIRELYELAEIQAERIRELESLLS